MASYEELDGPLGESDLLDTDPISVLEIVTAFVFHLIPSWLLRSAKPTGLLALPWIQRLIRESGDVQQALDYKQLTQKGGTFAEDHLLKNMARRGMLRDNKVFYSPRLETVHNIYVLSPNVCGHTTIVHGGFVSTMIDETLGYLLYLGKQYRSLQFDVVLTARLEVDFKAPLPADSVVCCTARIEKREGSRKLWVCAELRSQADGGILYASGRALFVVPRPESGIRVQALK